jgi:hypothetical protein
MNYQGRCFSAEYCAEHDVDRLIVEDLAYARSVLRNRTIAEQRHG